VQVILVEGDACLLPEASSFSLGHQRFRSGRRDHACHGPAAKPRQERCGVERDFLRCDLPPPYSMLCRARSSVMTAIRDR